MSLEPEDFFNGNEGIGKVEALPKAPTRDLTREGWNSKISTPKRNRLTRRNPNRGLRVWQMAELKARMAMLYSDGEFYEDIANVINEEFALDEKYKVSKDSVRGYVKRQIEKWRSLSMQAIEGKQAMVLERFNQIEELAINAYFASTEGRSIKKFEKEIKEARSQVNLDAIRDSIKAEMARAEAHGQEVKLDDELFLNNIIVDTAEKIKQYEQRESNEAGNPKFLEIMIKCNQERCKIWGLYIRQEDSMSQEQQYAVMDDKERGDKLGALLQAVALRNNQTVNAVNESGVTANISQLATAAPLPSPESVLKEKQANAEVDQLIDNLFD